MNTQLMIQLKGGDMVEGRLARSFGNNDTDVEIFVEGQAGKVLFSLDDVCCIRFHAPPASLAIDEQATVEQVQIITGETFRVAVFAKPQFLKGFMGVMQDVEEPFRTVFFATTGIRYRKSDRCTAKILREGGFITDEKIKAILGTGEAGGGRKAEPVGKGRESSRDTSEPVPAVSRQSAVLPDSRVGDILVEAGLVSREQVESNFNPRQDGKKLKVGELLIAKGLITEEQLLSALATKFRLRYVDLRAVAPSKAALDAISEGLANRLGVFPVALEGRKLVVATSAPTDLTVGDNLRFSTNCAIELVVSPSGQIAEAIGKFYSHPGDAVDTLLQSMKAEADNVAVEEEVDEARLLLEPDSEVISLVNRLLVDAYKRGASDIHFEPGAGISPLTVRYRIDGECTVAHKIAASFRGPVLARIKILALLDIAERRRPQSGKIVLRYQQQKLEYRVEITPLVGGHEAAVLRLLAASEPLPLLNIGLMPHNLKRFIELLNKPYGIILCVGPTGAGKTTTLHSALGHINGDERKIWTAEDPVEITQAGLCQVQVNPKIGFTFAEALRSFLRADPDVIMIGEMRDPETAKIAIEASLTGHLVLSTLHTNSAPETAVRLIEMGMDPFNFGDALLGIVAQRLAKRLCEHCKKKAHNKRELYDELVAQFAHITGSKVELLPPFEEVELMEKCGCDRCGGSGYKGRIAIHELMVASHAIKNSIRHEAGGAELRDIALAEGMWTLKMDGILKVMRGATDLEQLLRSCT